MNDQSVNRVDHLTTTFLDTLAVLLLAAAAGWALWTSVGPAAGLGAAGVIVFAFSQLAQRQATVKHERPKRAAEPSLPGPEDPGPLHVMGR